MLKTEKLKAEMVIGDRLSVIGEEEEESAE